MTARAAGIILVAALLSVPVPAVDGASREHHQTDSLRGQEASVDRRFGSVPAADSSPVPSPAPTPLTRAVETRAPSVVPSPRVKTARVAPVGAGVVIRSITGTARWYGGSRGFGEILHAAMPGGRYTGKVWGHARVCRIGGSCIVVALVDFCACGSGSVIDLSRSAFDRLGDPRRGVMRVRVEVMG